MGRRRRKSKVTSRHAPTQQPGPHNPARRTFLWTLGKLVAGYAVLTTAIKNTRDLVGPWVAKPTSEPSPLVQKAAVDSVSLSLDEQPPAHVAAAAGTSFAKALGDSMTLKDGMRSAG
jgi:hypothetical protein